MCWSALLLSLQITVNISKDDQDEQHPRGTHGIFSCFTVSVVCLVAVCGTASSWPSSGLFADCARRLVMGECEFNAQCCPGASISGCTYIISFVG